MPAISEYPKAAPSRARRRRGGRGLLISVIVLALLLVAADRIGLLVAERAVASKVQSSQHLTSRPAVHIRGFPFLTQVIADHYQAIKLDADHLTVGTPDKRVALDSLDAQLSGVRATNNFSGVTAEQVTATAQIGYPELSQLLGIPLGYQPGGRIQTHKSVTVLGQTITGTVSAVLTVPGGDELGFSNVQVGTATTGVQLPQAAINDLTAAFSQQLSLAGLPFGLKVRELAATSAGIRVTAVASNVSLG